MVISFILKETFSWLTSSTRSPQFLCSLYGKIPWKWCLHSLHLLFSRFLWNGDFHQVFTCTTSLKMLLFKSSKPLISMDLYSISQQHLKTTHHSLLFGTFSSLGFQDISSSQFPPHVHSSASLAGSPSSPWLLNIGVPPVLRPSSSSLYPWSFLHILCHLTLHAINM